MAGNEGRGHKITERSELAPELGAIFAHFFQQSIDKGEIHKDWSLANICPLFKREIGSWLATIVRFP